MAIWKSRPASQDPQSSLRLPAQKRISTTASQRLSAITEDPNTTAPSRTTEAGYLLDGTSRSPRRPGTPRARSGSRSTQGRPAPPAYDWVPEPLDGNEEGNAPIEGEKLAKLRRDGAWRTPRRGGWGRLSIILAAALLVIIGLAVGLGVGLSQRKHSNGSTVSTPSPSGQAQHFPLGKYSIVTALRDVETACTNSEATWRCYPFNTFNTVDGASNTTSLAAFNVIITNTSPKFATPNNTQSTPEEGIPADLTISTTYNPFDMSFSDKPLTYIASSTNSTSARYTFNFTTVKSVIPSPAITSNNAATECFFNETLFTGSLYLSAPRDYPSDALAGSTAIGGFQQWPYAVEITETAVGGHNVPNCYETVDGHVGAKILKGLHPQSSYKECVCNYRNY